jgi:hypothetical protein
MTDEYYDFLNTNGYALVRQIGVTHWAALCQFAFTTAIIVGTIGDRHGYDDRWCYHSITDAAKALSAWDGTGEPEGWHRHPLSGRRRSVEGEEYVLP